MDSKFQRAPFRLSNFRVPLWPIASVSCVLHTVCNYLEVVVYLKLTKVWTSNKQPTENLIDRIVRMVFANARILASVKYTTAAGAVDRDRHECLCAIVPSPIRFTSAPQSSRSARAHRNRLLSRLCCVF